MNFTAFEDFTAASKISFLKSYTTQNVTSLVDPCK